jgi:hypothetical protein
MKNKTDGAEPERRTKKVKEDGDDLHTDKPESGHGGTAPATDMAPDKNGRPIGGWLILLAIGMLISPFMICSALFKDMLILKPGVMRIMTSAGTEYYNPALFYMICV